MATPDRIGDYVVYATLADSMVAPIADLRVGTDHRGRHRHSGLRYRGEWLRHPGRFPLNPIHAPLTADPIEWVSAAVPAVIDEVLPGRWERAVLARTCRIDVDDLHAVLSNPGRGFRIGAIGIAPAGEPAPKLIAAPRIAELEPLARHAADLDAQQLRIERHALERLRAGSSVGGARPKVLVSDEQHAWIAKLNRPDDRFNYARVEHVCLELARAAGIDAPLSYRIDIGGYDALLVERFDVSPDGGRRHVISANALLKDGASQADHSHPRYDDLAALVRSHSAAPASDLKQLFGQMLLNEAINNLDDHLRNFSLLQTNRGWRLAPAYDLVPDEALGGYPNLALGYRSRRPRPDDEQLAQAAEAFSLAPREASAIAARVIDALEALPSIAAEAHLSDRDWQTLRRVAWQPEGSGRAPLETPGARADPTPKL